MTEPMSLSELVAVQQDTIEHLTASLAEHERRLDALTRAVAAAGIDLNLDEDEE